MLLEVDGLETSWDGHETIWHGELGQHNDDDYSSTQPHALCRLSDPEQFRRYDSSGMGRGDDYRATSSSSIINNDVDKLFTVNSSKVTETSTTSSDQTSNPYI